MFINISVLILNIFSGLLHDGEYVKTVPTELSFDDPEANCEENKYVYSYAMDMTTKEVYQVTYVCLVLKPFESKSSKGTLKQLWSPTG